MVKSGIEKFLKKLFNQKKNFVRKEFVKKYRKKSYLEKFY